VTLFSLDTSTRIGSMGLWRDGAVIGRPGADTRSHAERLPLEAEAFLAEHGCTFADIDRFVVVSGPGSFTGLRVGVAAVQGWAFALNRPVTTVGSLEALVEAMTPLSTEVAETTLIVPCLDGLRGEVFFGAWWQGTALRAADVGAPAQAIEVVQALLPAGATVAITGDGASRYGGLGRRRMAHVRITPDAGRGCRATRGAAGRRGDGAARGAAELRAAQRRRGRARSQAGRDPPLTR
jgi:tRNA threonylcarbamoyladenosine biosynthesis protein TsaB